MADLEFNYILPKNCVISGNIRYHWLPPSNKEVQIQGGRVNVFFLNSVKTILSSRLYCIFISIILVQTSRLGMHNTYDYNSIEITSSY